MTEREDDDRQGGAVAKRQRGTDNPSVPTDSSGASIAAIGVDRELSPGETVTVLAVDHVLVRQRPVCPLARSTGFRSHRARE